jgi:peptide-methionine (S)-S-oxide reductase
LRTRVGYTGGSTPSPTYEQIADHTEALQIDFDPRVLSYELLVDQVFSQHDPTERRYGTQYMAAVWTSDERQHEIALRVGERAARARGGELATRIERLARFTRAEDYHQKFYLRQKRAIADELLARFGSDEAMVDSTAAAWLNGWMSGHGARADVERRLPSLSLSEAAQAEVLARLR